MVIVRDGQRVAFDIILACRVLIRGDLGVLELERVFLIWSGEAPLTERLFFCCFMHLLYAFVTGDAKGPIGRRVGIPTATSTGHATVTYFNRSMFIFWERCIGDSYSHVQCGKRKAFGTTPCVGVVCCRPRPYQSCHGPGLPLPSSGDRNRCHIRPFRGISLGRLV